MTSTFTGPHVDRVATGPAGRGSRALAHTMVAMAIGCAALSAGLDPLRSLLVAALAGLLTLLLPPAAVSGPAPKAAVVPSAIAEQRRGDAVRLLALELSVDRLRSVLESLREGVVVVDSGAEVVLVNPEARHALRDPASMPIGRVLWDVLAPELAVAARQAFAGLDDDTLGRDRPIRLPAIPFGQRVLDLTAVRVRSRESGQDFGTVFLFVDATRSHELAHLKDRFLSGISHELRTPLTNICAYAEILRHITPGETSEWPEFVRIVHEESLQLNRLVDTVFDYAQLESGEAQFTMVERDVADLVQASCARVRERATTRGVTLRGTVPAGLPIVSVDVARFSNVLDHLLDNALKFTPRDGTILVTAAGGAGLSICIEDSGPGIAAAERDSVFEKFNQLGDHLTEKATGTGLGLATTKVIVQRMGGTIRCDASSLGGAALVVALPAVEPVGGPAPRS